ncbi:MAG TPA: ABC transporter permease [Chryseolinea sp.]
MEEGQHDKKPSPPASALQFLEWFCPPKLYEGIEGDLVEQFQRDMSTYGHRKAGLRLWMGVLRFFRPGIVLRNRFSFQLIKVDMLRNYVLVAFRNVLKNKVFSGINVFGLGIGLAACLLILQFVMVELSYDKFHTKLDRIYRVTNDRFQHGKLIQHGTITYPTIGPAMAKDFPEVERYTRLMPGWDFNAKVGDRFFRGDNSHFADEHFFAVFDFPLLATQGADILKDRYSVALSEKTAKKYFDIVDNNYSTVIGKTLYRGMDTQPYKVVGVFANIPDNSHLQFDMLVSYSTLISPDNHGADDSWTWSDMRHYLLLKPGTNYKKLEAKFEDFSQRHFQGDKVSGSVEKFFLQPLKDAHLYSDYEYDIAKTASGKAVWAMLIVAAFILLIAWVNYINLTTSRALERAKEVGLRKVMGAVKGQLMRQFVFESMLISLFAFVLSAILTQLLQRPFNEIIGSNLSIWSLLSALDTKMLIVALLIIITGVLLSGFYPAVVLSSYQPITVLKGKFQRSSSGNLLRKALVVFQFTTSVALITGTLIVSQQLKFMNSADLGISIANTIVVEGPETPWDSTFIGRIETYKNELTSIPGVISATTSNNIPSARLGRIFDIRLTDQPNSSNATMSFLGVDHNFFYTYNVPLIAGRKFLPTDHNLDFNKITKVVVNESGVKLLGLKDPEEAVGKSIKVWDVERTIVGVVSNFHQEALQKPMEPIVFIASYGNWYPTSIKVEPSSLQTSLAGIKSVYERSFPGNSFDYFLLEDRYNNQYKEDKRFASVVNIFTGLAILVSCLGLIGLSSYTAILRTKEIGIRKVLGASLPSIVTLLSIDFLKLILVAALLALPVAYFSANQWLLAYAYRISPGWTLFVIPVLVILIIAAVTMSFQIIRSALANPAETLKYE